MADNEATKIKKTERRWCCHCASYQDFEIYTDTKHAELWGNSHAVLWENSHAVATSPYAILQKRSGKTWAKGGTIVDSAAMTTKKWLKASRVTIRKGKVILYKSVKLNFGTQNGIFFKPGTEHWAPDWNPESGCECGGGIHYAPTVAQARWFRDDGVYIACEVLVADMAGLPAYAEYPDKIRARGGKALYRVNAEGERIEEPDPVIERG